MQELIILLFGGIGGLEIALILFVVLLVFGGKKIPELMKGLGQGLKDFKKANKEDDDDKKESEK